MASLSNRAALLAAFALGGCSLVTTFDLSRAVEDSDAVCSDGIDNDGNGLTDCQDWSCLSRKVCCTRPVVVLADDFSGAACAAQSCTAPADCAPDPSRWAAWGTPTPVLCQGGLSPHKAEQCYPVGAVGLTPLTLHPGLSVAAHLEGQPEAVGGLELGLTLKASVVGGVNACATVEGAMPIVSIQQAGTATGYKLQAFFDGAAVGVSREVASDSAHEAGISVGGDRTVSYLLDGEPFAASPASQPLPEASPTVHVVLQGVGLTTRFADVRVTDGTQCDSPASWTPSQPFSVLEPSTAAYAWDSQSVSSPAVVETAGGDIVLYYSGCSPTIGAGGCGSALGFGRAVSIAGAPFVRDAKARFPATAVSSLDVVLFAQPLATVDDPIDGYFDQAFGTRDWTLTHFSDAPQDPSITVVKPLDASTLARSSGSWDDDVCCSTVLDRPGQRLLWYSGHVSGDPVWRIGFAVSMDGGAHFTRVGTGPVLSEGARESDDGRGVLMPEVIFDESRQLYRMWYTAIGLFGVTSIGYAVSTDGVTWHKFPGNPVISAAGVGLESLGRPAVVDDGGRTRMWVHGVDPQKSGSRIFALENDGVPSQ